MSSRRRRVGLVAVLLLVLSSACSSGAAPAGARPSERPGAAVSSAPPVPRPPQVGACHALTLSEATDPVDTGKPVPCRTKHTSVTIRVGQLSPVADGHLLAVDSRTVRAQIAKACPAAPAGFVGGDRTTQRLSRFEVVAFSPSLEQADAGANQYRCDIVAVRSQGQLQPLPARLRGVLDEPGALDRFGTCGTAAPGARGFTRVVCSLKHSWRAVAVVELPAATRYLAKDAAASGDSRCKDVAAGRAKGALKYAWSFEWPTRPQWAAGQRYGYCWVPSA